MTDDFFGSRGILRQFYTYLFVHIFNAQLKTCQKAIIGSIIQTTTRKVVTSISSVALNITLDIEGLLKVYTLTITKLLDVDIFQYIFLFHFDAVFRHGCLDEFSKDSFDLFPRQVSESRVP